MSHHEVLVQHMVDVHKAAAEFREAAERKPASSSHINSVNKHFATRSVVQMRLGIYNWKPRPRRGKEDAFEKTNCRKVAYRYLAGGFRIC